MVDLIIPDSLIFPYGWMSPFGCEINNFALLHASRYLLPLNGPTLHDFIRIFYQSEVLLSTASESSSVSLQNQPHPGNFPGFKGRESPHVHIHTL